MKKLLLAFSIYLGLIHFAAAQWTAADTFAFAQLSLRNPDDSPYVGPVRLVGKKRKQSFDGVTNSKGKVNIKVPFEDSYFIYCGEEINYKQLLVRKAPYVTHSLESFTQRHLIFTFSYKNEAGQPIKGEWINLEGQHSGLIYSDTTDEKGNAKFYLPLKDAYTLSVKYKPNFRTIQAGERGQPRTLMSTTLNWMGSKEKDRQAAIADSLARLRYAEILVLLDSLDKAGASDKLVGMGVSIPITSNAEWVEKCIRKKANIYEKELEKNPRYFEKEKKTVLAIMKRLEGAFKNKVVVTDVTGSMYPYMEQILIWHALNKMENATSKYLFFNDGDLKTNHAKIIGKTGGLYFCEGSIKDMGTVIRSMRKGMSSGGGGDCPENDVEALIEAQRNCSKADKLVLIADNFSPMRDYALIKELKIPVHVIICGIEGTYSSSDLSKTINEEYINLAYQTAGSIHTLSEDIWDLKKQVKDGILRINGVEYELENNQFIKKTKL